MKKILRRLGAILLALTLLVTAASALTVEQALGLLETSYLREIPEEAYQAETLDELFNALGDPYTYYMSAEDYQAFLDSVEHTTQLVGIGVSIQYTSNGILVVEALKGGSAQEAGIQAGDVIVAVDGVSCVPANEGHRALIVGEEGSSVTVTVLRDGTTREYTLERRTVVIPNTETTLLDGRVGYIDCDSFGSETGQYFRDGITEYNDRVDTWLVDLRGNSGGQTTAAVEAIGTFAGAGFHLWLRTGLKENYYYYYPDEALTDKTAVVLVNGGTASAAEAFAASMRDLGCGLLVGSRTYGKGVAQVVLDQISQPELFDGDAVKVTAYRFYSAGYNTNDLMGVLPTLLVSDEQAEAVAKALCGSEDIPDDSLLVVVLGSGRVSYVDLRTAAADTLAALFEALPPSATLQLHRSGALWDNLTVAQAAARLNVTYTSRWFTDVADSQWADQLNTLASYRVLRGVGGKQFMPEAQITRADVCRMIAQAMGISSDRQYFSDVPATASYSGAVNAMAELGLVDGIGGGKFAPQEPMSREQYIAVMARLARWLNFGADTTGDSLTQEELDAAKAGGFSNWSAGSAALLSKLEMLYADPTGLDLSGSITRAEAGAQLYSVLRGTGIVTE